MKQPVRKRIVEANNIDQTKYRYILVCDMNNIMKISSVDHRMNNKGNEYGIVLTSLRMVGEILKKKDFDFCYAAYDGEGSGVLRWQMYPDYKSNRGKNYELYSNENEYYKKLNDYARKVINYSREKRKEKDNLTESDEESFERQKGILQEILDELCIRQFMFDKVEGDDVVSYIVKNKEPRDKIVIVSSDKDLTQLISDTVIIYNPRTKDFITKDNSVEKIGITHENVVLQKMLCGDASDNIKGIKGIGETTLAKLFPSITTRKMHLNEVLEHSKQLLEERKAEKKKPLKSLENIINSVTDGCQGDKIYEINRKIIDLSKPLLTEEAEKTLKEEIGSVLDTDDRDVKNVYRIISDNGMDDITDERRFGDLLAPYSRIIMMEKRRYGSYKNGQND